MTLSKILGILAVAAIVGFPLAKIGAELVPAIFNSLARRINLLRLRIGA